jgi:hypothetical protein
MIDDIPETNPEGFFHELSNQVTPKYVLTQCLECLLSKSSSESEAPNRDRAQGVRLGWLTDLH